MASLLDFLAAPSTGNGVGGLLSYLNTPLYQSPILTKDKQETQDFASALTQDPYGALISTPAQSAFDRPGINYTPAPPMPAPSVFDTGAGNLGGFTFGPQGSAPQMVAPQAPPATPAPPSMPPAAPPVQPTPVVPPTIQAPSQQAALPQNAQPTQGQLPTQQDVAQPQIDFASLTGAPTGGNPVSRFLQGLGTAITNIPRGGVDDPRVLQQRQLQAQFVATRQALIANGVAPGQAASTAMLAVLNPEAAKTILPELLTSKEKFSKIGTDMLGRDQFGFVNERDQTVNGKPVGGQGQASNGLMTGVDESRPLYDQLPKPQQAMVDNMLSGRMKPPPGQALRTPYWNTLMAAANEKAQSQGGNFDETNWSQRNKTAQDFAPSGKSGQAITAFNTVQHHIGKLSDDTEKLGNGGWTAVNSIRNLIAGNTPFDPARQKSMQAVADDVKAVTDEMSAAYKAGHVSDSEISAWNRLINTNMPLPQMRQALADFVDLLNGKRDALNSVHRQIMGGDAPTIDKGENETITQKVKSRNLGEQAAGPKVGEVQQGYRFKGGNPADKNSWEKVQ